MGSFGTRTVALILAGCALVPPAAARHRPSRPATATATATATAPSAPARRVTIPYQRFTLPNGLTTIVYTDHTTPSVFVGLWYRTGSKDEPAGKSGFAHLFEHLMFQQTANRRGEFTAAMEGAGAVDVNGSTNIDQTNYYETVPASALDFALWLESDRMGYLDGGITQAVLDEQRRVVQNEKRQSELRPETDANAQLLASFYPAGHPYAHPTIGSMADLDAASLADVKHWFVDHYGASNAVLVLAGDIDLATAKEKVSRYFGAIRPGQPGSQPLQWIPALDAVKRDVVYGRFAAPVVSRTWAISNADPRDTTLLQLAARTMAGRRTAPLARALIDDRPVATAVSAEVSENRLASIFTITMTLRPGVTPDAAGRALDEAMRDYLATGPSPERLAAVVTASDMAVLRSMESNAAIGTWLVEGELAHGDPLFFLKQRDWIAQAGATEVRDIARRWLQRPYYQQDLQPIAASPGAAIADVDRTHPPALGPIKTGIVFPKVTRTTLSNGLTLVVAERHRLPLVDMSMEFATATPTASGDGPEVAAAAFGLMRAGSRRFDAAAVAQQTSRLGTDINVETGLRHSALNWSASVDRLDESFTLAADLLRAPLYSQADVARVAAARGDRLNAREQDPMAAAAGLFAHAVWGDGDPRGRIDGGGDVSPLTRDAILRFHDREIGPRNATLYMIGDITPDAAQRLAERHFGDWRANMPTAAADPAPAPPQRARIILIDMPGAQQSSVTVGNLAPPFDKDASAAEALAVAALASGSVGRLNMNLREDKGWTYGFGGGIDDEAVGERLFSATGTIEVDKTAAAIAELRGEIADFVSTRPITAAELDGNRDAALRAIPFGLTDNGAFLASMIASAQANLPYDRAAGTAARLSAVTLDDARRAAVRAIRADRLVWVVVGDLKTIEPGIRALGIAPVEVWDVHGRPLR